MANLEEVVLIDHQYKDNFEFQDVTHTSVKGNVQRKLKFGGSVGTSKLILDAVSEGYLRERSNFHMLPVQIFRLIFPEYLLNMGMLENKGGVGIMKR